MKNKVLGILKLVTKFLPSFLLLVGSLLQINGLVNISLMIYVVIIISVISDIIFVLFTKTPSSTKKSKFILAANVTVLSYFGYLVMGVLLLVLTIIIMFLNDTIQEIDNE